MADKVHIAHSRMGIVDVYTPAGDSIEWCQGCGASLTSPAFFTRSADKKGTKVGIRYVHCSRCSPLELVACKDCGATTTSGWNGLDWNLVDSDGTARCRSCAQKEWNLSDAIAQVESAGYRVVKEESV